MAPAHDETNDAGADRIAAPGELGLPPGLDLTARTLGEELALEAEQREARRKKKERRERERPLYRREEIATTGFDDFLQTIGSDPTREPVNTGLRIPAAPASAVVDPYLFLAAVADLEVGDRIVGWRQLLTIAAVVQNDDELVPRYVVERPVVTTGWHFQDAFASFFLTTQSKAQRRNVVGPFDQMSFILDQADGPALVYTSAHFPALPPAPGYLGLDQYKAPAILGQTYLTSMREIRSPFHKSEFDYLFYTAKRPERVRAWIWVKQTNPTTRPHQATFTNTSFVSSGLPPEENFLQVTTPSGALAAIAQYWRCGVSLIVDRRIR